MKRVYIYAKAEVPTVSINQTEAACTRLNQKWVYLDHVSAEITVKSQNSCKTYTICQHPQHAIYKDSLIKIFNSPKRILLITDLDNTIFNPSPIGLLAYETFIKTWLESFEFNGSKLVYNTGRCLREYNKDKERLFEPDLVLSVLGNYCYKYDQASVLNLQDSLPLFVDGYKDDEWDAQVYYQDLVVHFPWIPNYSISVDPYNLYFKILNQDNSARIQEVVDFVKTGRKVAGKVMKAKTILTSQGSSEVTSLEIIPKFAGKGLAVRYAQWLLGFSDWDTFLAGDSLNDKDALKLKIRGVIVGNAEQSLVSWYRKKTRNQIVYTERKYALGVVDLLTRFNLYEHYSTVFVYRESKVEVRVTVMGREVELKPFKAKWVYFRTAASKFCLEMGSSLEFDVEDYARYAVYKSKLLRIERNIKPILLVSDLDNTLFNESEAGIEYYEKFVEFWIAYHEFNGSVLVYNTGRNLPHYQEDEFRLFRPDLVIMCLSSFAYYYDENIELKEDHSLRKLNSVKTHDWDTELFTEWLCETFNLDRSVVFRSYDTYLLLKLEEEFAIKNYRSVRDFARNKANQEKNGFVFHAKVTMMRHNLVDQRYFEIRPLFVGKGIGLKYAQKKFSFDNESTYAAGDTPNDIDALKNPVNSIVMANSEEMLLVWLNKKRRENAVLSTEPWALGLLNELQKKLIS